MAEGDDGVKSESEGRRSQLALFIENVTDYAVFILDPGGHVASWNRGAERIKGYTASEIFGQHFSVFYTDEDRARDHPAHELEIAVREGRYEEEGWRVRKDGSRFWASVVITALRDGDELVGFGKVTRDLTTRRLGEEQLRSSAERLRAANVELDQFHRLVASVRDYAIFMLDPGGHIMTWNLGARYIKGYEEAEIVGRHFSTFYTAEDRAKDHPGHELEIASREGRYEEEGWRVRKDGSSFWASVVITAVRDDGGALVGFAKVTRDLTTRRRAEEEMRAAHERLRRANDELDRFAVVAAHDLTAPLNTTAGFVGLLRDALPADASAVAQDYVAQIDELTARMQALVENLLVFARAGEVQRPTEAVSVSEATGRVIGDLRAAIEARGAVIDVTLAADTLVMVDPSELEMVLRNLIDNAIKFAGSEPRVQVYAEGGGRRTVRVVVADNGIGIKPGDQADIFEAFTRVDGAQVAEGVGLGLAICERSVRRSGGEIGVDSAPGEGSRFWFTLPRAA